MYIYLFLRFLRRYHCYVRELSIFSSMAIDKTPELRIRNERRTSDLCTKAFFFFIALRCGRLVFH